MIGYIYLTTNLINGKKYVGRKSSTKFLDNYFGSGIALKRALNKYGVDNFKVELLKECFDIDDLIYSEMAYIKKFNAVENDNFYNKSYGGYHEGFIPGEQNIAKTDWARQLNSLKHKGKRSPEFCEKQRQIHLGKPSGMLGKHHTEATKDIIRQSTRKYNLTDRDYKQISEHHKGSKMMTNGIEQHWFYGTDVEKMLNLGWWFGECKKRKPKQTTEKMKLQGKQLSEKLSNTVWVHKDNERHQIKKYLLDQYLNDGYKLGMK